MNKKIKKVIVSIILIFSISICINNVHAKNTIEEEIEKYTKNIDTNNITKEQIVEAYDKLSKEYTNDEIANIIEENSKEIEAKGINKEVISAGANFVRTSDPNTIKDVIENDIDIDSIKQKVDEGYTPNEIVKSIVKETPNEKKVEIAAKLIFTNKIVKTVIIILAIWFIYGTILRWKIYEKAGKPGWAAIVPVYRQIVMYKVCDLSAWLMILWLIPVIGWIALLIIAIMKRFCLAKAFNKGTLFGFGLLIFPPIFQSILAFA